MTEKNFGYLGTGFQQSLIKAILEDKKYGDQIIGVIENNYFDNQSFKFIIQNIKEYYNDYNKVPDYESIALKLKVESSSESQSKVHLDTIESIKSIDTDIEYVKDEALNFCKQQNLKKELKKIDAIINGGEFENYKKIEDIIQKAMQVGLPPEEATDIFKNFELSLENDVRHPIPTGVNGLDNVLEGGLGRGELGVVLAPTGTGKTTLLTKFANTAFNYDFHVLQIFFEDSVPQITRKHTTIWTGVPPQEQFENRDTISPMVEEVQQRSKGSLNLMKLPSDSITIGDIKNRIRKFKANGNKLDMLLIDYVDCISPDKGGYDEEWKGDGAIMRGLETMTGEFDIAIWTATQGNRQSISSEVVTTDQMGGSIKKAQIGHVVLSVAKTLEQKEHNLATLTLLKSRIGRDGVIWSNCTFDNKYLKINTDSQNTLLGHEEEKVRATQNRMKMAFERGRENQNRI